MVEDPLDYEELRALAAELLRAQRDGDFLAFRAVTLRCAGRVDGLLISLTAVANKAMDRVLDRDAADKIVRDTSKRLPAPPRPEELVADVWRDAIATVEAAARDDEEAVRAIMLNTNDLTLFYGYYLQLVADVLLNTNPGVVQTVVEQARADGPPNA